VVEGNGAPENGSAAAGDLAPPAGSPQAVEVTPLGRAAALPAPVGEYSPRATRILPLSAKSSTALGQLAERYLAWLDACHANGSIQDAVSSSLLADMAWTAGIGRSHFVHRAGVVFRDGESLRNGLSMVAASSDLAAPRPAHPASGTPPRLAFVYPGDGSAYEGMGRELHDREPVVRAILDRCDAVLREQRDGASLLDVMFGRNGAGGSLRAPEWAQPAVYALATAVTALWASVGIRPGVVAGQGIGELAAAWAADLFTLEDGLRLAAARGTDLARPRTRVAAAMTPAGPSEDPPSDFEASLHKVEFSPPSLTLLSQVTWHPLDPARAPGADYRRALARAGQSLDQLAGKLAALDIDMVLDIGTQSTGSPVALSAWPEPAEQPHAAFDESVASAYEAGFEVSFSGLFAGEARRRISLPAYPFERRRHWIDVDG